MRYVRLAVASLITASLLAACGGGNSTSPVSSIPQMSSNVNHSKLPKFLRLMHTPARPPLHRHPITAAMRANARKGGWEPLNKVATFTNGAGSELLMTDGTVLVQDYCSSNWFKLTPDNTGSYQNGTWTEIAAMPSSYGPLYFASAVLPDGKVMVNGGEYNFCRSSETNLGAIYDPAANSWTAVTGPSGWSEIGDAQSIILTNGTYMIGNCCTSYQAQYNEGSSSWTQVGTGKSDANSEEGWTLLRNGDILTADVFGEPNSELFDPKSSSWSSAGDLPVNMTQDYEIGPQTMRANNTVLVEGADGYTSIYDANTGKWSQGPNLPNAGSGQLNAADAPSTLMTDDTVMMALSPGVYSTPASFWLFNGKKITALANPPDAGNDSSYNIRTLLLPTGQVLEDDGSNDVEIYTAKLKNYKGIAPSISSVPTTLTEGSTYKISGKRFNGYSQANFYGDDDSQATNFPLVRVTNNKSQHVFYFKTHDINYMGIGSAKTVTTNFDVPTGVDTGASKLEVVTNGIASRPVSVTIGSQ